MKKPVIIYVEGAICSIIIHPTEDLFRTVGSFSLNDVGSYIIRILEESFGAMRKGESQWTTASLLGNLYARFPDLLTLSVSSPPNRQDYASGFKKYTNGFDGIVLYNCGNGQAKWVTGELAKQFPDVIDIAAGRDFPHDFMEEEKYHIAHNHTDDEIGSFPECYLDFFED